MALSANRASKRRGEHVDPITLGRAIADNVHLYSGGLVGRDTSGYARPMTLAATTPVCLGVAEKEVDNTGVGHAAGAAVVPYRQGTFILDDGGSGGAITAADIGSPCYASDDHTVNKGTGSSTYAIAGTIVDVDAAGVWVRVGVAGYSGSDAATLAALLAATGGGALVGILDSAGLLAAGTVEAALAEIVAYEAIALADPGTGQAIPVTRSATVDFTIGSAGAETNTLAVPTFEGQRLILNAATVGTGTRAVTCAQAINQAANTIMTFAQARDFIMLVAIKVGSALRWTVAANDGVALS